MPVGRIAVEEDPNHMNFSPVSPRFHIFARLIGKDFLDIGPQVQRNIVIDDVHLFPLTFPKVPPDGDTPSEDWIPFTLISNGQGAPLPT